MSHTLGIRTIVFSDINNPLSRIVFLVLKRDGASS